VSSTLQLLFHESNDSQLVQSLYCELQSPSSEYDLSRTYQSSIVIGLFVDRVSRLGIAIGRVLPFPLYLRTNSVPTFDFNFCLCMGHRLAIARRGLKVKVMVTKVKHSEAFNAVHDNAVGLTSILQRERIAF